MWNNTKLPLFLCLCESKSNIPRHQNGLCKKCQCRSKYIATGSRKMACAREVVGHYEHIAFPIILLQICLDFMYRRVREWICAFNLLNWQYLGRNMFVQCVLLEFSFVIYSYNSVKWETDSVSHLPNNKFKYSLRYATNQVKKKCVG